MSYYTLNEDKEVVPCHWKVWADMWHDDARILKRTWLDGNFIVTEFRGLNSNNNRYVKLTFETLIKNAEGRSIYLELYDTYTKAIIGHWEAIQWVKRGCDQNER